VTRPLDATNTNDNTNTRGRNTMPDRRILLRWLAALALCLRCVAVPAAEPHAAGPNPTGPHAAGPHAAGPHAAGPHAAGPNPTAPNPTAPAATAYPAPQQADWVAHDFRFHDGTVMPELKLHYTTVGAKTGEPVLIIHGTAGSGTGMLNPAFAGALFGPGQPLDARKYFIILPDTLGAGKSTRPSDGMRGKFPHYDYDDMVLAEYRLVTEGLGLHHLRLVLGNSMGGMHSWLWGVTYPGFADALVPMASQPTAMAARNWMLRKLMIETVRQDPAYADGNYTEQPRSLHYAAVFYATATNGGTLAYQQQAPTAAQADALVAARLAAPFKADANDWLYQWDASRDYDPSAKLDRITAWVLAINGGDDERNPDVTGVTRRAMARLHHARLYLIPASAETRGHGTPAMAKFWAPQLAAFLRQVPHHAAP
jgi:homoserine O-acetyltransferase